MNDTVEPSVPGVAMAPAFGVQHRATEGSVWDLWRARLARRLPTRAPTTATATPSARQTGGPARDGTTDWCDTVAAAFHPSRPDPGPE